MHPNPTTIPYGYCHCGCGQKTTLAPQTQRSKGWIHGEPVRFRPGHNNGQFAATMADRFWRYLARGNPSECWLWQGMIRAGGYGVMKFRRQMYAAHRVSYELHHGPIADGYDVLHKCDNPPCCNPAHLLVGTHAENMRDMVEKGRLNSAIGSKHGLSKVTEMEVYEIRQRSAKGESYARLARAYGITKSTIYSIVNRKTWTHIP